MYPHNLTTSKSATMWLGEPQMRLTGSASEQNVYFTYVCLLNEINPTDSKNHGASRHHNPEEIQQEEEPIKVERTKALHELVGSYKKHENAKLDKVLDKHETDSTTPYPTTTSDEGTDSDNDEFLSFDNPNILKLTKMKWLSEEQPGSPDSSSPSLSPARSCTSSNCSRNSDDDTQDDISINDKYLSTILRLDKEHNMFGLSSIAIVGSKQSRKIKKEDERPVFHQTAIVQVCCAKRGCRHKTNSDLPASLKCGGCGSCMACLPSCVSCAIPTCDPAPCTPRCTSCPRGTCICKGPFSCPPVKCSHECSNYFGLKVSLNRKPKYEQEPIKLTPRSSCVLLKPMAARTCYHTPQCVPPSSCFPYLMPCYWPARPSAPCATPARCFHNPPCLPARKRKSHLPSEVLCPKGGIPCSHSATKVCPNMFCPGKNEELKKAIEDRYEPRKPSTSATPTAPSPGYSPPSKRSSRTSPPGKKAFK